MYNNDDIVQSFEASAQLPLTVVSEAFPSRYAYPKTQVHVNVRLCTGRNQSQLTFHEITRLKLLSEALSETITIIEEAYGKPGQPVLVTKAIGGAL